jgi:hypothetical protein
VTSEELDLAIEELESRLERLRALYEQYFLGFEKVEPAVARKDVDRRIYVLRREKIRNTGKRFKLQTLIQRYNTFQQYWQRVCREIENGTYRRLLQRAERKFGPDDLLTIAAQRRFGRRRPGEAGDSAPPERAPVPSDAPDAPTLRPSRPEAVSSVPAPAGSSSAPLDANGRVAATGFAPEEPGTARRLAPPPKPVRRPTADGAAPGPSPLPPRPEAAPARPDPVPSPVPPPRHETVVPRPAGTPPAPRPRTQRPSAFDSLKLDMDFLGDWDPGSLRPNAQPAKPPAVPPPAARPPAPSADKPPAAPARPAPPAAPSTAKPKSSPRAAPAPRPAPKPAPEAPAKQARPASGEGFDARVRELHEKLNELKRQNREGSQVSLEGLAKSLRDTEAKLREKHGSRRIDFEVVLKDGRAVVKPIVR